MRKETQKLECPPFSMNCLLAYWISPFPPFFLLPLTSSFVTQQPHLEREYVLFQPGMPALGTILGTGWKAVIWIDNIYPCFKFIWTNLAQATGNRRRKWVKISQKGVELGGRALFISLSCTGSRELLLWQYFNATLAICTGILQIHE